MGHPQPYRGPEEVFVEMTGLMRQYRGLRWRHLAGPGKLWPCPDPETSEGTVVLFGDGFPTKSGRGKFSPAEVLPPAELPDAEYPFVLNTGRTLTHWHTGSMTRRASVLDAITPEAFCEMNPGDLARLRIAPGSMVRLSTRRSSIRVKVDASTRTSRGGVFIPFHFREAAANLLTNDVLDPFGKIPEFKFCAVKVEPA
jgi:formate dehydrogenase major subunit